MKGYNLEGKLIGSIRYCGTDQETYVEVETYQSDDGSYYNMKYIDVGDGKYRIEMKKSDRPIVQGREVVRGYIN